jgi:CO/xanthine dehydrogenase Mo-binding subunit
VVAVVLGADLPEVEAAGPDKPLALDRVFYSGQPVAAVVAETEAAAADAAALIEVDFEPRPVVAGPDEAMRDGAPEVLESGSEGSEADAAMHGAATGSESEPVKRPRNVSSVARLSRGDVAAGLAAADVVVKATYRIAGVHHSFIEPHVSIVRPEPGGGVTVWAPTQGTFMLRDEIAKLLDAAPHEVRVIPMPVGGGFGGKVVLLEPLLALLARKVRRPVRLSLTRQQEFQMGRPAPAARFDLELGAKRDGTLVGLRVRYDYDNGRLARRHHRVSPRRDVPNSQLRADRLRSCDQQDSR